MNYFRSIFESIYCLIFIIVIQILLICGLVFFSTLNPTLNPRQNSTKDYHQRLSLYLNRINSLSQQIFNYLVSNEKSFEIKNDLKDVKNIIQIESKELSEDLLIEEWRKKEFQEVSQLIQRHINELQNPEECLHLKNPLICNHTNNYGFAAGIHDVIFCLVAGFYSNRTVILLTKDYHYLLGSDDKWNDFFLPLSSCDHLNSFSTISPWPGSNNPVSRRLIHYLPKNIGRRIVGFHSLPMAFFLGEFAKYILRPSKRIKRLIKKRKRDLDFNHPIVGLHVRRSDKIGSEASFHNMSEYLERIQDFFGKRDLKNSRYIRRIYLATDDPKVWTEVEQKYLDYEFLGNKNASFAAMDMKKRYKSSSLSDLLVDLYLLSETDFLVCTMSSNVCRLAFELMNSLHHDGGSRGQSLDIPFHYAFASNPKRLMVYPHKGLAKGEVVEEVNGEELLVMARKGKKRDSYLKGINVEFPEWKTKQIIPLL